MQIRINVKGASRKRASIRQITEEYPSRKMAVEEFLSEMVRRTVRRYNEKKDAGELLRLFSAEELEDRAVSGKIAYGDPMDERKADEEKAVKNALQCFEDGIVALFVDGVRYTGRDEEIPLREQSEVTFIKLTSLAGRIW